MKIAVLASGGGSNFQTLIDKHKSGELPVEFALMIGNNSKAKAFERAQAYSIPTKHIAPTHFKTEETYVRSLLQLLEDAQVELIVLAGYMKMIPAEVIKKFRNKIVNIHPALLPAFGGQGMYGMNVHKAVVEYGAKVSGITVHFVDEEYDHGPVIYQDTISVLSEDGADEVAAKVLKVEHQSLWKVVRAIATKSIRVEGRRVVGTV